MKKQHKVILGVGLAVLGFAIYKNKSKMTPTPDPSPSPSPTPTNYNSEFEKYMIYVFDFEGGLTIDKNDRGGLTNWGIDQKSHPDVDIRNLTKEQAKAIYWNEYWLRSKASLIPKSIRFLYFDTFINGGGIKVLQRAAGVKIDGSLGLMTITAASRVTPQTFTAARRTYYSLIIKNDKTQEKFRDGWNNRATKALNAQLEINSFA